MYVPFVKPENLHCQQCFPPKSVFHLTTLELIDISFLRLYQLYAYIAYFMFCYKR